MEVHVVINANFLLFYQLYDFGLNLCGNGVVDAGETCDCGQVSPHNQTRK